MQFEVESIGYEDYDVIVRAHCTTNGREYVLKHDVMTGLRTITPTCPPSLDWFYDPRGDSLVHVVLTALDYAASDKLRADFCTAITKSFIFNRGESV